MVVRSLTNLANWALDLNDWKHPHRHPQELCTRRLKHCKSGPGGGSNATTFCVRLLAGRRFAVATMLLLAEGDVATKWVGSTSSSLNTWMGGNMDPCANPLLCNFHFFLGNGKLFNTTLSRSSPGSCTTNCTPLPRLRSAVGRALLRHGEFWESDNWWPKKAQIRANHHSMEGNV